MNSLEDTSQKVSDLLLPTGSEDKEVRIGGGEYSCGNSSLFTCQDMKSIALKLHEGSTHAKKIVLSFILNAATWALVSIIA